MYELFCELYYMKTIYLNFMWEWQLHRFLQIFKVNIIGFTRNIFIILKLMHYIFVNQLCDLLTLEDHGIEKDENIEVRLVQGLLGGGAKRECSMEIACTSPEWKYFI